MARTVSVSVDRFEGDLAVLVVDDDGRTFNVPRSLLPEGTRAGDVLTLSFSRDAAATKAVAEEGKRLQDELKATDPGGDVTL